MVQHPTHLSQALMLLGVFLWTGVTTPGIVTAIDAIVVNIIVIPLEEREMSERFGKEYEEYRRKVHSRFLPHGGTGERDLFISSNRGDLFH